MENKVFIGGLCYSTNETELLTLMEKFGHVTSIRIVVDIATGKSKGFGFVTFEKQKEAEDAITALNNTMFKERMVGVKKYLPKTR